MATEQTGMAIAGQAGVMLFDFTEVHQSKGPLKLPCTEFDTKTRRFGAGGRGFDMGTLLKVRDACNEHIDEIFPEGLISAVTNLYVVSDNPAMKKNNVFSLTLEISVTYSVWGNTEETKAKAVKLLDDIEVFLSETLAAYRSDG